MCRLDMFLVSKKLQQQCIKTKIIESIRTDHKLIYLEIDEKRDCLRGRGFFKVNNSLLTDETYIKAIHDIFHRKKKNIRQLKIKE